MNYRVEILPSAIKDLRKLPNSMIPRVKAAVLGLAEEPRPVGSRKLVNVQPETWRIRVGDWRTLYRIDEGAKVVQVVHVFHRRDAYR